MNPYRGDVTLVLNGEARVMRLTLGALAELEARLEADSLLALVERFENGTFRTNDLIALLQAGLRGGGQQIEQEALLTGSIGGGPMAAAKAAALLLKHAFSVSDEPV